jgi:hypothetical protein
MGWQSLFLEIEQVIVSGPSGSILVYNGTPALGNLIASITPISGTDPQGNFFFAGITSYEVVSSIYYATSVNGPVTTYASATSAGGPYTTNCQTTVTAEGNLIYTSGSDGNQYWTGTGTGVLTTNKTINSLTPITIGDLSLPVSAQTYEFYGWFVTQQLTGADPDIWVLEGPGTPTGAMEFSFTETNASPVSTNMSPVGQLGGYDSPAFASNVTYIAELKGTLTFPTSGIFAIAGRISNPGDSWQVIQNSFLRTRPLG